MVDVYEVGNGNSMLLGIILDRPVTEHSMFEGDNPETHVHNTT